MSWYLWGRTLKWGNPGLLYFHRLNAWKSWALQLLPCLWVSGHLDGRRSPRPLLCKSLAVNGLLRGAPNTQSSQLTKLPALTVFLNTRRTLHHLEFRQEQWCNLKWELGKNSHQILGTLCSISYWFLGNQSQLDHRKRIPINHICSYHKNHRKVI